MMLPTRCFAFLNRTGTLVRAAVCCGVGVAFLSMASAPAFAAEMDNLKQQLRDLQTRLDQLESQQAAPPVMPPKMVQSGKSAVKLTLSGQVSRMVIFADDGEEDAVFHSDNALSSTRWRLKGAAKFSDEWSIGTLIEQDFDLNSSSNIKIDQETSTPKPDRTNFDNRHFTIWFDSKSLGRLWIGRGDTASNGTSERDLSGTILAADSSILMAKGLEFRVSGTGAKTTTIGSAHSNFDGRGRAHRVRYDTPTFTGFKFSTSHIQGDIWDVALSYRANYKEAGVKVDAAIAYSEDPVKDDEETNGSISVLHKSGFNVTFMAATLDRVTKATAENWWVKAGYQFPTALGKLSLTVDYGEVDDLAAAGDEFSTWGLAAVQKIDKTATELYIGFRNHALDKGDGTDTEDINAVFAGARVKF